MFLDIAARIFNFFFLGAQALGKIDFCHRCADWPEIIRTSLHSIASDRMAAP